MNYKSVLIIAFKIAAIFLVVNIIDTVPSQMTQVGMLDGFVEPRLAWITILLPAVIKLLIASLFWFFPYTIVKLTVPQNADWKVPSDSFEGLSGAFVSAIGVYLFCYGLTDLVYFVALKSEMAKQFNSHLQPTEQAAFIATLAQILIGVCLVVGNKGFSRIVLKVRQ